MKKNAAGTARVILFVIALGISASWVRGDILLQDFDNSGFGFAYGSWVGAVSLGSDYVTVGSPADEMGGAGFENLFLNLSQGIQIEIFVLPVLGNEADRFNFILKDSDGTEIGWHFDLNGFDDTPSQFSVLTASLVTPHFINSTGTNPSFNFSIVNSWQLQGDFSSEDPLRLQFDRLAVIEHGNFETVIPEPSTMAFLISGLGSLLCLGRLPQRYN